MKTILHLIVIAASLVAARGGAQTFSVTGHVVAGGGGTASGGLFQITGTIGQLEAGPRLTGGCFSIDPGFWGAYAVVLTPGAPVLRIRQFGPNYIRVSFPPGCGDWVLQWTTTLGTDTSPTIWTDDAADNLVLAGEELTRDFHVPSWGPRLFFRLRAP